MTVSLDSTLITLEISTLIFKGQWKRVVDRTTKTDSSDIFIGAAVTEHGETQPDIDLCAEIEAIKGFVLGYAPQLETIDSQGYYYRDEDHPFAAEKWIRVGIPDVGMIILVCSGTNKTIGRGDKIKCVDGLFEEADTNDNYQMIASEAVTGASNTRKYFYAEWVKA